MPRLIADAANQTISKVIKTITTKASKISVRDTVPTAMRSAIAKGELRGKKLKTLGKIPLGLFIKVPNK